MYTMLNRLGTLYLNRLVVYARSKPLSINTAKSEAVHFNSKRCAQVPTIMFAGAA